jgi:hypothetical protein
MSHDVAQDRAEKREVVIGSRDQLLQLLAEAAEIEHADVRLFPRRLQPEAERRARGPVRGRARTRHVSQDDMRRNVHRSVKGGRSAAVSNISSV